MPFAPRLRAVLLSIPAKDPVLNRALLSAAHCPALRPDRRQDLRIVAPVVRLSVPGAPARLAQLLEATGNVAAPEILHGVLGIFSRQGALRSGATEDGAGTVSESVHTFGEFLEAAGNV